MSTLRGERKLTLRELAKEIGCSASYLCDVELSKRAPSRKMLKRLATLYGVELAELLRIDPRPPIRQIHRVCRVDAQYGQALRALLENKLTGVEVLEMIERFGLGG